MAWDDTCAPLNSDEILVRKVNSDARCERAKLTDIKAANSDLDFVELLKSARDSVVRVDVSKKTTLGELFTSWRDSKESGQGTGFVVGVSGKECLIVTDNHVVTTGTKFSVRSADGTQHNAIVVKTLPEVDLALLKTQSAKTKEPNCVSLPIEYEKDRYYEHHFVLGHPDGANNVVLSQGERLSDTTSEELSRKLAPVQLGLGESNDRRLLVFWANTTGGNSGSPVIDTTGKVVAIQTKAFGSFTFATPAGHLRDLLKD